MSSGTLASPAVTVSTGALDRASTRILYVPAPYEQAQIEGRIRHMGYAVAVAADTGEATRVARHQRCTIALVHLSDERTSLHLVRGLRQHNPHMPVIGLLDAARPLAAAEALRAGISDLLTWPLDEHDLAAAIVNARDRMSVAETGEPGPDPLRPVLFANSPAMRLTIERVRWASQQAGGVLIVGEEGTGRELVARAIHERSVRAGHPFLAIDCAEGSLHDLETRLFGVVTDRRAGGPERRSTERVASSGAVCAVNGGTLFLRNLVDAPSRVQAKLARLLRDREAGLVEARQIVDLDFRLIATVDASLDSAMTDERIRRDLTERLAQVRLEVPPLRRRREDIPLIAAAVLRELAARRGGAPKTCSRAALVMLAALPWPGNGRELRTLLETLTNSTARPVIQLDDLFEHVRLDGLAARVEAGGTLRDARARFEREWISAVLLKHHGRVGEAAKALGIQRTNLYRKVRQLKVARTLLGHRRSPL